MNTLMILVRVTYQDIKTGNKFSADWVTSIKYEDSGKLPEEITAIAEHQVMEYITEVFTNKAILSIDKFTPLFCPVGGSSYVGNLELA